MTTKRKNPTFTAESIQARIDDLIAQRDAFVQEANQRISMFNGAIQGLDSLLHENGAGPATDKEPAKAKE